MYTVKMRYDGYADNDTPEIPEPKLEAECYVFDKLEDAILCADAIFRYRKCEILDFNNKTPLYSKDIWDTFVFQEGLANKNKAIYQGSIGCNKQARLSGKEIKVTPFDLAVMSLIYFDSHNQENIMKSLGLKTDKKYKISSLQTLNSKLIDLITDKRVKIFSSDFESVYLQFFYHFGCRLGNIDAMLDKSDSNFEFDCSEFYFHSDFGIVVQNYGPRGKPGWVKISSEQFADLVRQNIIKDVPYEWQNILENNKEL